MFRYWLGDLRKEFDFKWSKCLLSLQCSINMPTRVLVGVLPCSWPMVNLGRRSMMKTLAYPLPGRFMPAPLKHFFHPFIDGVSADAPSNSTESFWAKGLCATPSMAILLITSDTLVPKDPCKNFPFLDLTPGDSNAIRAAWLPE